MILNRKSAKPTSRVSLFIALAMISTMFIVLHAQGYHIETIVDNSASLCGAGLIEIFSYLLF